MLLSLSFDQCNSSIRSSLFDFRVLVVADIINQMLNDLFKMSRLDKANNFRDDFAHCYSVHAFICNQHSCYFQVL
jgi:hypothetical protein